ncbi:hypothetical protein F4810DRAFT_649813, partial [Camillea tinctor]
MEIGRSSSSEAKEKQKRKKRWALLGTLEECYLWLDHWLSDIRHFLFFSLFLSVPSPSLCPALFSQGGKRRKIALALSLFLSFLFSLNWGEDDVENFVTGISSVG